MNKDNKASIVDFVNKFKDFSNKILSYEKKTSKKSEVIKMPILKLLSGTFNKTIDNITMFTKMAFVYSLIVFVIHQLTQMGFVCKYKGVFDMNYSCNISGIPAVLYVLFHIVVFALFVYNWQKYICSDLNRKLDIKSLFKFDLGFGKFALFSVVFLILFLIPALSLYLLYNRVPNPDYRTELTYFVIVGTGFFVPFLLFRFTSLFSKVIVDGNIYGIKGLWKKTEGSVFKIFMILVILFLIIISVVGQLDIMLRPNFISHPTITAIIGDLINIMFICFYLSLFINLADTQRELLFKGANDNE